MHMLSIEDVDDADPWAGFELVNEELRRFDPELAERRQIEVVNKIDLVDEERLETLKARAEADGREIFFISAREEQARNRWWPNSGGCATNWPATSPCCATRRKRRKRARNSRTLK